MSIATYCSNGSGGGLPIRIGKFRLYFSCIFINTKLYAKNDIIIVGNTDVWANGVDIDRGENLVYLCIKGLTASDVYPLKGNASPPPIASATYDASNEFWMQLSPQDLSDILERPNANWQSLTLVIFFSFILWIILINSSKSL